MIVKRRGRLREFNWNKVTDRVRKSFKERFGKNIPSSDIKKIWRDWVQEWIIIQLLDAKCVKIDKHSTIEIVGTPLFDNARIMGMLKSGKSISKYGGLKIARFHPRRKDFVYKVIYAHAFARNKRIYFKVHPSIAKQVHQALLTNNIFYRINYGNN